MSFALTRFKAQGIRLEGEGRTHVLQRATFGIAAAATDIALDISSLTAGALGTFWTAAIADATYGTLAAAALAIMQGLSANLIDLQATQSETLTSRVKVASGATGTQYQVAISNHLPSITFVSGNAPTAYVISFEWLIKDGLEATVADLGAQF